MFALAWALNASAQSGASSIVNLSARGTVGQDSGAVTAGFIVSGSTSKTLLIRGVGPGLVAFGVPNTAVDVALVVYDSNGNVLASNDGYLNGSNSDAVASTAANLGAFSLSSAGDSAVLLTLAPGAYTVQGVPGANDSGDGTALVEVYDADVLTGGSGSTLVLNMAACGAVGQGQGSLCLGFVIAGDVPMDIFLHGVGPDLADFGVPNAASAVGLAVFDSSGDLIESNNGFSSSSDSGDLQATSADLDDISLSNPNDSAMILTLTPGAYSVIVTGGGSSAGSVALVEGFDLDAALPDGG
jgi:hypothetical protein